MRTLLLAAAVLAYSGAAPAQDADSTPRSGTSIVGERESPIGLYITPWRKSAPEQDIDRPARLLDETIEPLDPDVFRRQTEYHHTLTNHRAAKAAAQAGSN